MSRRVFLSRTSEFAENAETRSYVDAAKDACNRNGYIPVDMSYWTADPKPPAELCRRKVRECQIYVGIIGFNYGSRVRDDPERSYTEIEFDEARKCGKPTLIFLLDKSLRTALAADVLDRWEDYGRQMAFREGLEDTTTVAFFDSPDSLSRLIGEALTGPAVIRPPFMARSVPPNFVARSESAALERLITDHLNRPEPEGPATRPLTVALIGPGGFGKSVLADSTCHGLREMFPDLDVLRAELGETPTEQQLIQKCRALILRYDPDCPPLISIDDVRDRLNQATAGRRVLLLVDDVWRRNDLLPFPTAGPSLTVLITSRDREAIPTDARVVLVDELAPGLTQQIVGHHLGVEDLDLSPIDRLVGGWPLLAELVNGALRGEIGAGRDPDQAVADLARRLRERGPGALDARNPTERRRAIRATMAVSTTRLAADHGPEAAARYQQLAIFPEDSDIPLDLLARWWSAPVDDLRELAARWRNASLLAYDAAGATVRLHDVLRRYLRAELAEHELRNRQAEFVGTVLPGARWWVDLAVDADYLWRWACWHIHRAGFRNDVNVLIRDVGYLTAKTHLAGAPAVLDDLARADDDRAGERYLWFRRWSNLLGGLPGPTDLAATLVALPQAREFVHLADRPTGSSGFPGYAPGWACPEPINTAFDGVLGEHGGRVQQCAWSPDGTRLASVDGEGFVQVLTPDGGPTIELGDQEWNVTVAWSPDSRRLACADDDGVVRIWKVSRTHEPLEVGRHDQGVRALAWSPDGTWLASGGDDAVRVWRTDDSGGLGTLLPQGGWVRSLAWSPGDRLRLACALDETGDVLVWELDRPGAPTRVLGRHEDGAFVVAWSPDGEYVLSGGRDGVVRRWPSDRDGAAVTLATPGSDVLALELTSDGRMFAYGGADGTLHIRTTDAASAPVELGRHRGGLLTVGWRPHARRLASGGRDGALRLWRVEDGTIADPTDLGDPPLLSLAWSADGRRLLGGTPDGAVQAWAVTGERGGELSRDETAVHAVATSFDGMMVARGGGDGRVRVQSTATGHDELDLRAAGRSVRALVWSPVRPDLAAVGDDGNIRIWHLDETGGSEIANHQAWARDLAWSPDGTQVLTGSDDGSLLIWSIRAADPLGGWRRSAPGVRAVAWSAAGGIVTGHADGTVQLWRSEAGEPIPLSRHRGAVGDVAWSPDGSTVFSVGADHVLRGSRVDGRGQTADFALALAGSPVALTAHPTERLIAIAGPHGPYVLEYPVH